MYLYTFKDSDGREWAYTTQDIGPARDYARNNRLRLIANEYVWHEAELVEDYTNTPTEE